MQKILQPYLALDLIRDTKDGFIPNEKAFSSTKNIKTTTKEFKPVAAGTKSQSTLRLEMDSIKEENTMFKGLGSNHNRSMLLSSKNSSNVNQTVMMKQY